MKLLFTFAAGLALAAALVLAAGDQAEACGRRCRLAAPVAVVPVNPVAPGTEIVTVPRTYPIPRREPVRCGGCYVSYVYPSYVPPSTGYAYVTPMGYPRRDCWYDGYGRRFCN